MKKEMKIVIVSMIAFLLSATSAYAYNNKQNKDKLVENIKGDSNSNTSGSFSPCSSCAGCHGNCILKKL